MTDHFALLNEPRRPWVDPDSLKQKFLALSAEVHPDRVHNSGDSEKQRAQERYTDLNAAYNCLREPKSRLQHLLELELGVKPGNVQSIPPDLMDVFLEVSQACRAGAGAILLDNMTPAEVHRAVGLIAGRATVEVSGGVRFETLHDYAIPGVDVISIGALTHSAVAVDLSLTVLK